MTSRIAPAGGIESSHLPHGTSLPSQHSVESRSSIATMTCADAQYRQPHGLPEEMWAVSSASRLRGSGPTRQGQRTHRVPLVRGCHSVYGPDPPPLRRSRGGGKRLERTIVDLAVREMRWSVLTPNGSVDIGREQDFRDVSRRILRLQGHFATAARQAIVDAGQIVIQENIDATRNVAATPPQKGWNR